MKRFMGVLIVLALLLSACGTPEQAETTVAVTTAPETTESAPEATEPAPESNKITVGVVKSAYVTDYEDNIYTAYLEQQTGLDIEIEFFVLDSMLYENMLMTMVEHDYPLPDIIFDLDVSRETYEQFGKDGVFSDLAPYFNDRAKSGAWWDRFEQLPEEQQTVVLEAMTCDGAIYGFPTVHNSPSRTMDYQVYINRQWLDMLNLDAPTDPDSLYEVLKAFKGVDFNGDGEVNEIPLLGTSDNGGGDVLSWIINMFLYYDDQAVTHIDEKGISYEPATTDAYRDALRFIRKLYAEGLLSPLSFASNNRELDTLIENGVGIVCGDAIECFKPGSEKVKDYEVLPLWGYGVRNPGGYHVSTYVTRYCDNMDAAWSLLMAMSTEKSALIQRYGEEDASWKLTEWGLRIYDDTWLSPGNDNWRTIEATIYTEPGREPVPGDSDIFDRYTLVDEMWKSYESQAYNQMRTFDLWGESELVDLRRICLTSFVTGQWDIEDDSRWQRYILELQELM